MRPVTAAAAAAGSSVHVFGSTSTSTAVAPAASTPAIVGRTCSPERSPRRRLDARRPERDRERLGSRADTDGLAGAAARREGRLELVHTLTEHEAGPGPDAGDRLVEVAARDARAPRRDRGTGRSCLAPVPCTPCCGSSSERRSPSSSATDGSQPRASRILPPACSSRRCRSPSGRREKGRVWTTSPSWSDTSSSASSFSVTDAGAPTLNASPSASSRAPGEQERPHRVVDVEEVAPLASVPPHLESARPSEPPSARRRETSGGRRARASAARRCSSGAARTRAGRRPARRAR